MTLPLLVTCRNIMKLDSTVVNLHSWTKKGNSVYWNHTQTRSNVSKKNHSTSLSQAVVNQKSILRMLQNRSPSVLSRETFPLAYIWLPVTTESKQGVQVLHFNGSREAHYVGNTMLWIWTTTDWVTSKEFHKTVVIRYVSLPSQFVMHKPGLVNVQLKAVQYNKFSEFNDFKEH